MRSADKTKTRKKASEPPRETEDDVTRGLGGVRIGDENSDVDDPLNPDTKEDEDSEDEEELPLSGDQAEYLKYLASKTQERSQRAQPRKKTARYAPSGT